MTFLTPIPAIIAAAVAVPLLVLLYFLKLRRQQVAVSTTLLWRKSIHDLQVNSPFQRLRRNLLLLLQLLILAAICLALARPAVQAQQTLANRTIIIIDHSASMNATDVAPDYPTRLDQAKFIARRLITSLDDESNDPQQSLGVMLVTFAERARVVQPFTTDKSLLRGQLDQIQPTDQRSRLDLALQLIEPYSQNPDQSRRAGTNLTVYILSDGRVHQPQPLQSVNFDLRYIPIAGPTPRNLAFTSLAARRDQQNPSNVHLFAVLSNSSDQSLDANITLRIDGLVQKVTSATIPPAKPNLESTHFTLDFDLAVPAGAVIELAHDIDDHLPADNRAAMILTAPRTLRVLLITQSNPFLARALQSTSAQVVTHPPGWYELTNPLHLLPSAEAGYDLVVFDRYSPQQLPPLPGLYFAAVPPMENLQLITESLDTTSRHIILDFSRDHPTLRHVALQDIVLTNPPTLALPPNARTLATSTRGPAIASIDTPTGQHLIVSFDILQSNWPMQVSFPVFIANAVNHLAASSHSTLGQQYHTGDIATVKTLQPDDTAITCTGPKTLDTTATRGSATLPMFTTVGLYHCGQATPPFQDIAVNLLDSTESDLRLAGQLQIAVGDSHTTAAPADIQLELWPHCIAAALTILMIEWLIYTRRMHL